MDIENHLIAEQEADDAREEELDAIQEEEDEAKNEEFDENASASLTDTLKEAAWAIRDYIKAKEDLIKITEKLLDEFEDATPYPAESDKERRNERCEMYNLVEELQAYMEDGIKDGDDFSNAIELLDKWGEWKK